MKTEILAYKPAFKSFLLYFALMFGLFSVLTVGFYLLLENDKAFTEYLSSFLYFYFFIPVFNAAAFAFSTRKHDFIISEINDTAHVANWAVELLQQKGMRIKSAAGNSTVLESGKKIFRAFDNWFGAELITISATENEVIATGNFRYIDILDTKLKFGKVDFKNQSSR
ncbi:hypothetical protein [uncultured Pontibacter sp.]|uniref:hypothetical protein n=1 Tax=uncultured Pontibacter sp. TaxID=453356 RepID=UPI002619F23D|nr:hypothetical protein [uncultured Pontibacter sp.]